MERQTPWGAPAPDKAYEKRLNAEPETGRFAEPRSWWDRTSDEVASWFGNIDAMRRRQRDEAVGDHAGVGPRTAVDPDKVILDEVTRRFTEDRLLDASRIEIACLGRVVALDGEVTTDADRTRAEHLAGAVEGVIEVQNKLAVV